MIRETSTHVILKTDENVILEIAKSDFSKDVADAIDLDCIDNSSLSRLTEYRRNQGEYVTRIGAIGLVISEPPWVDFSQIVSLPQMIGRNLILVKENSGEILRSVLSQTVSRIEIDRVLPLLGLIHQLVPGISYRLALVDGHIRVDWHHVSLTEFFEIGQTSDDRIDVNHIVTAISFLEAQNFSPPLPKLLGIDSETFRIFLSYRAHVQGKRLVHTRHDSGEAAVWLAHTLRSKLAVWLLTHLGSPEPGDHIMYITILNDPNFLFQWINRESGFYESAFSNIINLPTAKIDSFSKNPTSMNLSATCFAGSSNPIIAEFFAPADVPDRLRSRTVKSETVVIETLAFDIPLFVFTSIGDDTVYLAQLAKQIRPWAMRIDSQQFSERYNAEDRMGSNVFLTESDFTNLEFDRVKRETESAAQIIASAMIRYSVQNSLRDKPSPNQSSVPPLPEFSSAMLTVLSELWSYSNQVQGSHSDLLLRIAELEASQAKLQADLAAASDIEASLARDARQKDELIADLTDQCLRLGWVGDVESAVADSTVTHRKVLSLRMQVAQLEQAIEFYKNIPKTTATQSRDELIELLNMVIMTRNWEDPRLMSRIDLLARQIAGQLPREKPKSGASTAPNTPRGVCEP